MTPVLAAFSSHISATNNSPSNVVFTVIDYSKHKKKKSLTKQ